MEAGLIAEFDRPETLVQVAEILHRRGYRQLDAYTPYPVHGLERALGFRRSPLTWMVFPVGIAGAALGYAIMWYCNAVSYPLNVGGRPPHAVLAFIPITFETMVLVSSLTAFALVFVLSGLPRLIAPEFEVPGFERASIDRFWVAVDARDAKFDREATRVELEQLGALSIAVVGRLP